MPSPVHVSLRIDFRQGRFGPGKASLLQAIEDGGSIAVAARATGLSYRKAWRLIEEMNGLFAEPLVQKSHGGSDRGGAALTPLGTEVLRAYEDTADLAAEAARSAFAKIVAG